MMLYIFLQTQWFTFERKTKKSSSSLIFSISYDIYFMSETSENQANHSMQNVIISNSKRENTIFFCQGFSLYIIFFSFSRKHPKLPISRIFSLAMVLFISKQLTVYGTLQQKNSFQVAQNCPSDLVGDQVPEIELLGTRNQPKNGFKKQYCYKVLILLWCTPL